MPPLVTPFVGVWIETITDFDSLSASVSHPSWVCGLKLRLSIINLSLIKSHPSWVCGLKLLGNAKRSRG